MQKTASDLASIIKKLQVMNTAELGSTDTQINAYIYQYMSLLMMKWARLAYQTKVSDALNITTDGYQTFKLSGTDISNMYEPLRILDSSGREVRKRVSFADSQAGWWKESANAGIHTKGMSGSYTVHYLKYPDWITTDAQVPEWPPAGYLALIYGTCGMILESRGFLDESNNQYAIAEKHLNGIVMANTYARGSTGGAVPSYQDVIYLRS